MNNYLELSKEIYSFDAIKLSVDAFSNIADITIEDEEDSYNCIFNKSNLPLEQTIKEFENYLIDISNKLRLI